MWRASIIITEWGHWFGLLGLLFLLRWRRSWLHATAATLTTVGVLLLWTPLARASMMAVTLPAALQVAFGEPIAGSSTDEPLRPAPLVLAELFRGVAR